MGSQYRKGREDHYLPQGYLRGFIDPVIPKTESQPLWVFDIERQAWRRRSTTQIGWQEGFYDFVGRQGDREHAEEAFRELENGYSAVILKMRSTGFQDWRQHSPFLLRYMQMTQCRSPLFREQFMREWGDKRAARVVGVEPDNKIKVDSLKLRRLSPGALKEGAISAMMSQIKRGRAMLESLHWQLRLASSVKDGFVTSDQPLMAWTVKGESFAHRSMVISFPLCWEACLIGRRDPLSVIFERTTQQERSTIRQTYLASARKFIASPVKL